MKVTLADIQKAREVIGAHILRTPMEFSAAASQILGTETYFKCEHFQSTGSFKLRGALNKISRLTESEKQRGVIAASAGNHAQGVALSASKMGVRATVVMPKNSSIVKQQATRNYGAQVILHGDFFDEAYALAREIEKRDGAIFVPPYEDELIIAGQGTVGLEIFDDVPDLDSVVISIGGGGIASGVATALKALNPKIKVYGVVAENASAMQSMFHGRPVPADLSYMSIADGIAVKKPSQNMYDSFIKNLVDDIVAVSDDEIAEAIAFLIERSKMVVEGSGAVSLAAATHRKLKLGKKTCLILSGGNIDLNLVGEILNRGLSRSGRIARISVVVGDRPGTLNGLTKIIAESGANILDVEHDRFDPSLRIRETRITFLLETKNAEHIQEIRQGLAALPGARIL